MELELNLAFEMVELMKDGWTQEEARLFIKDLLVTDYKAHVLKEVDEDICYAFNDVVSDIIGSVEALIYRMINNISVC